MLTAAIVAIAGHSGGGVAGQAAGDAAARPDRSGWNRAWIDEKIKSV
jgi:hypothetical protein